MKQPQHFMCGQLSGELLVRLQSALPDTHINTLTLQIEESTVPFAVYRWEVLIEGRRYHYQEAVSFQKLLDVSSIDMFAARLVNNWTEAVRKLHRKSRSDA